MDSSRRAEHSFSIGRRWVAVLGCAIALSCQTNDPERTPGISPAVGVEATSFAKTQAEKPLRFAVGSMISPATTYKFYEGIFRRVATQAGRPFTLIQRRSYQEVNELLINGQVDLAFICSGAFAALPQGAGIELVAVPVVRGSPTYRSYIISRSASDITQLKDMRGKRFAFTDPLSHTGYFYPLARLEEMDETPATFFSHTMMTNSHDRSITAVFRKLVDGAAVDSLVYHQLVKPGSRYIDKLRIVETSPPFPIPPFVSPSVVAPPLRQSFRKTLLGLHTNEEGRKLLQAIDVDRFVEGDAAAYKQIDSYADRARRIRR